MSFGIPSDFMKWDATCHHDRATKELFDRFMSPMLFDFMRLYYIWGHSYEINSEEKWAHMEEVCKTVGGRDDIWYATNIEIYDYIAAYKQCHNPY